MTRTHARAAIFCGGFLALVIPHTTALGNPIPLPSFRAPTHADSALVAPRLHDSVLVAYQTPQLSQTFALSDGQVTSAWSNLDSADRIVLDPQRYCYFARDQFLGPVDAGVEVRAATDRFGLYVLATVRDNAWVARDDSTGDNLHLFFDRHSADSSRILLQTECLAGDCFNMSQLGYLGMALSVSMARTPMTAVGISYYDENAWKRVSVSLSPANLRMVFGIEFEVVVIDSTTRSAELFIPWEKYSTGIPWNEPLGGPIGFSVSYFDLDSGADTMAALSWMPRDPFAPLSDPVWHWGDIWVNPLGFGTVGTKHQAFAPRTKADRAVPQSRRYMLNGRTFDHAPGPNATAAQAPLPQSRAAHEGR